MYRRLLFWKGGLNVNSVSRIQRSLESTYDHVVLIGLDCDLDSRITETYTIAADDGDILAAFDLYDNETRDAAWEIVAQIIDENRDAARAFLKRHERVQVTFYKHLLTRDSRGVPIPVKTEKTVNIWA